MHFTASNPHEAAVLDALQRLSSLRFFTASNPQDAAVLDALQRVPAKGKA